MPHLGQLLSVSPESLLGTFFLFPTLQPTFSPKCHVLSLLKDEKVHVPLFVFSCCLKCLFPLLNPFFYQWLPPRKRLQSKLGSLISLSHKRMQLNIYLCAFYLVSALSATFYFIRRGSGKIILLRSKGSEFWSYNCLTVAFMKSLNFSGLQFSCQ